MKRKKWIVGSVIVVIALIITGGLIMKSEKEKKEALAKQERQKELELQQAYLNQNRAFYLYTDGEYHSPREEIDKPFYGLYFDLAYYKKTTGKELVYAQIYDYLAREYENDDEIRIYTNGKHPEIADYVEWYCVRENKDNCERFSGQLLYILLDYRESYGINISEKAEEYFRNTAVMDELIKKEADPDYVMDERIMWEGLPYGPYADK